MEMVKGKGLGGFVGTLAGTVLATVFFGDTQVADAAPIEKTIYVQIDYEMPMGSQQAVVYQLNQGGQLVPFDADPNRPETSRFTFRDLVPSLGNNSVVWFRGVTSSRVIAGNPANDADRDVTDVSAYAEMNHHFVMKVDGEGRRAIDPCNRVWPIIAGSEFTTYEFPDGYGMRFKGSDEISGAAWHWANPEGVSNEDVFIEMTLLLDDANSPRSFTDVNVSWLSVDYCDYSFCLTAGEHLLSGNETGFRRTDARIVLAVPHVHDHAEWIDLNKVRADGSITRLASAEPDNRTNYATAHHCHGMDMEDGIHSHTHNPDESGHLPAGGLQHGVFAPGAGGPIVYRGEKVFTEAFFNVPDHGADPTEPKAQVDNMAIWFIFWEAL